LPVHTNFFTEYIAGMAGKSHHKRKSNKGGLPLRIEPSTGDLFEIFPDLEELFSNAGWLKFCLALRGYHPQIAAAFISSFNGFEATVAELTVRVTEDVLSYVFDLPLVGERWFKNNKVDEDSLVQFLKPNSPKPDWSVGISTVLLQKKWGAAMIAVREYLTCEGRYKHLYRFHLRFLLHLTGEKEMNLPFYLIKDLTKISAKIQKNPLTMDSSLSHHSLITMIVFDQIIRSGVSIRSFLSDSGFYQKDKLQEEVRSKIKKAAILQLPIEDDEEKTEMPVQKDKKKHKVKSKADTSHGKMTTRSQTKKQQTSTQAETTPVRFEEQSAEEDTTEKQSIFTQEPRRRSTRAANKFRLKAKALLDPSLKGKEPILIEDDLPTVVKTKGKKGKAKAVKIPAEPTPQASSSDLLVQLAEIAEFLETRSAEDMLEETQAMFSDQSKMKSPKSVTGKRMRRSKRKHVTRG